MPHPDLVRPRHLNIASNGRSSPRTCTRFQPLQVVERNSAKKLCRIAFSEDSKVLFGVAVERMGYEVIDVDTGKSLYEGTRPGEDWNALVHMGEGAGPEGVRCWQRRPNIWWEN